MSHLFQNRSEKTRLTVCAGEAKTNTDEVELEGAFPMKHRRGAAGYGMYEDVEPASNGIFWRVFPCLQAIAVVEVVRRLPIVEDFVTVLDWSVQCSDGVDCCKEEEVHQWR